MTHLTRFHSVGLRGRSRRMSGRIAVGGKLDITTGQVDSKALGLPAIKVAQRAISGSILQETTATGDLLTLDIKVERSACKQSM